MPHRPPGRWIKRCIKHVEDSGSAVDPGAVCGALWYKKMSPESKRAAERKYVESAHAARKSSGGAALRTAGHGVRATHGELVEWTRSSNPSKDGFDWKGRARSGATYTIWYTESKPWGRHGQRHVWEMSRVPKGSDWSGAEPIESTFSSADQAMLHADKLERQHLGGPAVSWQRPSESSARHMESHLSRLARVERQLEHYAADRGLGEYEWGSVHPLGGGVFAFRTRLRFGPAKSHTVTSAVLEKSWERSGHARKTAVRRLPESGYWAMKPSGKPAAGPFSSRDKADVIARQVGGYVQYEPEQATGRWPRELRGAPEARSREPFRKTRERIGKM